MGNRDGVAGTANAVGGDLFWTMWRCRLREPAPGVWRSGCARKGFAQRSLRRTGGSSGSVTEVPVAQARARYGPASRSRTLAHADQPVPPPADGGEPGAGLGDEAMRSGPRPVAPSV